RGPQAIWSVRPRLLDICFERVQSDYRSNEINIAPCHTAVTTADLEHVFATEIDEVMNGAGLVALRVDWIGHVVGTGAGFEAIRAYSSPSALTELRSPSSTWSIVFLTVQPPSGGTPSSCSSVKPNKEAMNCARAM